MKLFKTASAATANAKNKTTALLNDERVKRTIGYGKTHGKKLLTDIQDHPVETLIALFLANEALEVGDDISLIADSAAIDTHLHITEFLGS
jgi:hypothetical protein